MVRPLGTPPHDGTDVPFAPSYGHGRLLVRARSPASTTPRGHRTFTGCFALVFARFRTQRAGNDEVECCHVAAGGERSRGADEHAGRGVLLRRAREHPDAHRLAGRVLRPGSVACGPARALRREAVACAPVPAGCADAAGAGHPPVLVGRRVLRPRLPPAARWRGADGRADRAHARAGLAARGGRAQAGQQPGLGGPDQPACRRARSGPAGRGAARPDGRPQAVRAGGRRGVPHRDPRPGRAACVGEAAARSRASQASRPPLPPRREPE